jgi:hypothetical protein
MESFAFIGTRQPRALPRSWYQLYVEAAEYAARQGYTIHSGATPGSEQLAVERALQAGGTVRIYLPWEGFEASWVAGIQRAHSGRVLTVTFDPSIHTEWVQAIRARHPAGAYLARASLGLYARTYGLVRESSSLVALPFVRLKNGAADKGQTQQGLEVAAQYGLEQYDLSEEEGRAALRERIAQLK